MSDDGLGGQGPAQAGAAGVFAATAGVGAGTSAGIAAGTGGVAGAAGGAQPLAGQGRFAGQDAPAGQGGAGGAGGTGGTGVLVDAGVNDAAAGGVDAGALDAGQGDAGASLDAGEDAASVDAGDGDPEPTCNGQITYTLAMEPNPTPDQQDAYDRITEAMDTALSYYNCYAEIEKELFVSYVPSVATADGNPNGSIRFGSTASMNHITAMHEVSHTLGVGDSTWDSMMVDGIFPGVNATAQLREITGDPTAEVHGDNQHFWPYGLNYVDEVMSEQDLIDHCAMVAAIRKDLGYD
jgi:hypothetical protein